MPSPNEKRRTSRRRASIAVAVQRFVNEGVRPGPSRDERFGTQPVRALARVGMVKKSHPLPERSARQSQTKNKKSKSSSLPTTRNGLQLFMAPGSITGYRCVSRSATSASRPFEVRVSHNGRKEHLGSFETAVEAAYCFACFKNDLPFTMPPSGAAPSHAQEGRERAGAADAGGGAQAGGIRGFEPHPRPVYRLRMARRLVLSRRFGLAPVPCAHHLARPRGVYRLVQDGGGGGIAIRAADAAVSGGGRGAASKSLRRTRRPLPSDDPPLRHRNPGRQIDRPRLLLLLLLLLLAPEWRRWRRKERAGRKEGLPRQGVQPCEP